MKHVLVPLLTTADVTAIPTVVDYLKSVAPLAVVIVNNPSLGISPETATAEVDKQIADLEAGKKAAADREDFAAAHQFKEKIEDAKMKRQDVLREGYRKVPEAQRFAAYDELVKPFTALDPSYVESVILPEDVGYDNLLVTLANMGSRWPVCLPKDQWSLVTPLSIDQNKRSAVHVWTSNSDTPKPVATSEAPKQVQTAPKAGKPRPEPPKDPREARRLALKPHFTLMKAAKDHGFDIAEYKGRSPELVELILNKEFPAAA